MVAAGLSLMICSLIHRRRFGGATHGCVLAPLRQGLAGGVARRAVILCAEHRIGQRNGVDVARIRVAEDVGIDEERNREVGALAWPQMLLGEAEALQLVEIDAG